MAVVSLVNNVNYSQVYFVCTLMQNRKGYPNVQHSTVQSGLTANVKLHFFSELGLKNWIQTQGAYKHTLE